MTIRDLLASTGGGAKVISKQTFTVSAIWTKPADVLDSDLVVVDIWGAGGSGGIRSTNGDRITGSPGAGGAHNRVEIRAGDLNATENVVVGSGGLAATSTGSSANGNPGGSSSFKGHQAFGGGAGGQAADTVSQLSSGGGTLSAGLGLTGASNIIGGRPQIIAPRADNVVATNFQDTSSLYWAPGEWGGGSIYQDTFDLMQPIHGGAAGNTLFSSSKWRSSVWGGAAGGGYIGSSSGTEQGGTSQFGGNGGSVAIPASNTTNANGGAGSARGGGGSGAKWGSTGTVTSGAGGRGEVVITVYRGI